MYKKLCVVALASLMCLSVMTLTADAQEQILGPWLWIVAPTEVNKGGKDSTDVDSLAVASDNKVTEDKVSQNGAKEGDKVGDYEWTELKLPANGDINKMLFDARMVAGEDMNDITSYALIMLKSAKKQEGVTMRTGSDDSLKVWLNGEIVFTKAENRGRAQYQDAFKIDLKQGQNLLLVKVSERGGGWGMHVGIEAAVEHHVNFDQYLPVEPAGKLATQWAKIRNKH